MDMSDFCASNAKLCATKAMRVNRDIRPLRNCLLKHLQSVHKFASADSLFSMPWRNLSIQAPRRVSAHALEGLETKRLDLTNTGSGAFSVVLRSALGL